MRSRYFILLLAATVAHPCTAREASACISVASGLAAALSPDGVVRQMLAAYQNRDLAQFSQCLTADFHYDSDDPDFIASAPKGFTREDEISSADHLFRGVTRASGQHLPAARAIVIQVDRWGVALHPAQAPSWPVGAMVTAHGVTMALTMEDGTGLQTEPACNVFEVVRGDLGLPPPGVAPSPTRYFVRRWHEYTHDDCPAALLAEARPPRDRGEPDSTEQSTGSADSTTRNAAAPTVLAIRPENPTRDSVRLALALPTRESAQLEVYDIAGRRVRTRDFEPAQPRTIRFDLRDQGALPAGIYWVRLRQAAREVHTRVVLLH